MDPKRYPRRGKIRRKSRNRKNINTKNIHFIDTSLLLPRILLSYHVKTRPFSCASFSVIIDAHRPAIPILPPFHAFCISVVYTYYRKIHPFSAQHNYNFHTQSFSGSGIHAPKGQKEPSPGQSEHSERHPGLETAVGYAP